MESLQDTALPYHHYTLGKILFFLANQGLRRVNFDQSDAMDIMDFRRGDESEVLAVFHDVLHFMMNEQIIHVSRYRLHNSGYDFNGVKLTAKGLQLIQADPSKIDKSLSGSIVANTKSSETTSTDTSYYGKWGEFAGSFIASVTKSLGSG